MIGDRSGSVAPGDRVICNGRETTVRRVIAHPPGNHPTSHVGVPLADRIYVETTPGSWAPLPAPVEDNPGAGPGGSYLAYLLRDLIEEASD